MGRNGRRPKEPVLGARIMRVRLMTEKEAQRMGWNPPFREEPMVLELDSGAVLFTAKDFEGNGPGALFGFAGDVTFALTLGKPTSCQEQRGG